MGHKTIQKLVSAIRATGTESYRMTKDSDGWRVWGIRYTPSTDIWQLWHYQELLGIIHKNTWIDSLYAEQNTLTQSDKLGIKGLCEALGVSRVFHV